MKTKRKILSLVVVIAMLATLFIPATVSADTATTWDLPTQSTAVEKNSATGKDVITVGAHAAASTIVHYLGGNLVTNRTSDFTGSKTTAADRLAYAQQLTELGVFGTSVNDVPDPYLWNYCSNLYDEVNNSGSNQSSDTVALVNANPFGADTTLDSSTGNLTKSGNGVSKTIAKMPNILLGTNANSNSYDTQLADLKVNNDDNKDNDYDPVQMAYTNSNLDDCISKMYTLADNIVASGKSGRYDTNSYNTVDIAKKYEAYIKGLQLYVQSEINAGTVKKRTVAIVDPSGLSDGTYEAYNSGMAKGTAASCRAAEYVENTTNNIIDTQDIKNSGEASSPEYIATAKQIASADAIFITVQEQLNMTADEYAKKLAVALNVSVDSLPPIYATDPNGAFSIRANSVENFVGVGQYQAFVYPELINPAYAAAYVYENFYHVSGDTNIKKLTSTALKDASLRTDKGANADATGYTSSYIDNKIAKGMTYYAGNVDKYSNTKLALTDRLDATKYSTKSISASTTSKIANKVYTGKALKPALTVKLAGKTLKNGTDYTVAYSKNVKAGKAKAVITGKGNYNGTKTVTFKITPKKAVITKITKAKKAFRVGIKSQKSQGVKVYQIAYKAKGTKQYKVVKTTSTSKVIKKLKSKKIYYVKVRAYSTTDCSTITGAWSHVNKIKTK